MENLHINKTKYTLAVDFDVNKGILKMSGSSYPENALEFFKPIFECLKQFINENKKTLLLELNIDYLNTSSTKCLLDIFEILESYQIVDGSVQIKWFYQKGDEDIFETGKELAEDYDLLIDFISYE
ncbi:MAG: DUF1987 domain-containing protein [bacterium]